MPLNIRDLAITSPQIAQGERIPDLHAADHGNTAPKLNIAGVPDGTVELALIMHDPDAPLANGFTHWVVYGINPKAASLDDSAGWREGPNSLGEHAYSGPQPPPGHGTHHYYFWLYALDTKIEGTPTREEFLAKYADNIIEQNRLVGTYSTPPLDEVTGDDVKDAQGAVQ